MIPKLTSSRKAVSEFKDPFRKDALKTVHIHLHEDGEHSATVQTRNGNSIGEQRFYSGDVNDLFQRIDTFVQELK